MSTSLIALLLSLVLASNEDRPSTIEFVDGSTKKGIIQQIDGSGLTILLPDGSACLSTDQILGIDIATAAHVAPSQIKVVVSLQGGGLILAQKVTTDDHDLTVTLIDNQPATFPIAGVRGVLFGPVTSPLFEQWKRKCEEPHAKDILLADKGGEQAELEGIIGDLGEERISFTIDGEKVDVRRERVRALYFAITRKVANSSITVFEVSGNRWPVQKIEWNKLGVTLSGESIGSQLRQASDIARIDYSGDRVTYLSDLDPVTEEHVPYFDTSWPMQRDCNFTNGPIRMGKKSYRKGLVIHSKTTVTYSLDSQYQQLQLTADLENDAGPLGHAVLQFIVDNKVVKELPITADSAPIDLNIDVKDARQLSIVVDYGALADLGDHVALGNARLVK